MDTEQQRYCFSVIHLN